MAPRFRRRRPRRWARHFGVVKTSSPLRGPPWRIPWLCLLSCEETDSRQGADGRIAPRH